MEAQCSWGGRRSGAGRKKGTPNKATADVKFAAQVFGPAAIQKLAGLAGLVEGVKPAESEQAQVAACKEILDRAYGKAPQALTVDPGNEAVEMMKELFARVDGQSRGLPNHARPQLEEAIGLPQ